MKHIIINNVDYILYRRRGGMLELVDKDLNTIHFPEKDLPHESRIYSIDLPIVPSARPFPERDRNFVVELQSERARYLATVRSIARIDKAPKAGSDQDQDSDGESEGHTDNSRGTSRRRRRSSTSDGANRHSARKSKSRAAALEQMNQIIASASANLSPDALAVLEQMKNLKA